MGEEVGSYLVHEVRLRYPLISMSPRSVRLLGLMFISTNLKKGERTHVFFFIIFSFLPSGLFADEDQHITYSRSSVLVVVVLYRRKEGVSVVSQRVSV